MAVVNAAQADTPLFSLTCKPEATITSCLIDDLIERAEKSNRIFIVHPVLVRGTDAQLRRLLALAERLQKPLKPEDDGILVPFYEDGISFLKVRIELLAALGDIDHSVMLANGLSKDHQSNHWPTTQKYIVAMLIERGKLDSALDFARKARHVKFKKAVNANASSEQSDRENIKTSLFWLMLAFLDKGDTASSKEVDALCREQGVTETGCRKDLDSLVRVQQRRAIDSSEMEFCSRGIARLKTQSLQIPPISLGQKREGFWWLSSAGATTPEELQMRMNNESYMFSLADIIYGGCIEKHPQMLVELSLHDFFPRGLEQIKENVALLRCDNSANNSPDIRISCTCTKNDFLCGSKIFNAWREEKCIFEGDWAALAHSLCPPDNFDCAKKVIDQLIEQAKHYSVRGYETDLSTGISKTDFAPWDMSTAAWDLRKAYTVYKGYGHEAEFPKLLYTVPDPKGGPWRTSDAVSFYKYVGEHTRQQAAEEHLYQAGRMSDIKRRELLDQLKSDSAPEAIEYLKKIKSPDDSFFSASLPELVRRRVFEEFWPRYLAKRAERRWHFYTLQVPPDTVTDVETEYGYAKTIEEAISPAYEGLLSITPQKLLERFPNALANAEKTFSK